MYRIPSGAYAVLLKEVWGSEILVHKAHTFFFFSTRNPIMQRKLKQTSLESPLN